MNKIIGTGKRIGIKNSKSFLNKFEEICLKNGLRLAGKTDLIENYKFVLESNKYGKIYFHPKAECKDISYSVYGKFEQPELSNVIVNKDNGKFVLFNNIANFDVALKHLEQSLNKFV